MGKVLSFVADRLANIASGLGTTRDRSTGRLYFFIPITGEQAEAGYRTSWLVRKIVDIPALDMTRAWRNWQAEGSDIEAIEDEERRLQLREKCKRALILSRLYGGGALILGTGDGDPMAELKPDSVTKQGLKYIHVMARHELALGQQITDPESPWFREPEYFQINGINGQGVKIHPSRVIPFIGQKAPEGCFHKSDSWYWGDPIMLSVGDAVKNADTAQAGFAALIEEAKIDIIKIPDLLETWATDENEAKMMRRLEAAQTGKSTWRALLLDTEEEWETREATWAGMMDVLNGYLQVVAGAADIPATRLLGQSPKGLQSNGDGEERDYHSMVKARQDEILAPALDRVDEILIRSALGERPDDVWYKFGSLKQNSEKEEADLEKVFADTIKIYADTGLVSEEALGKAAINGLIERGNFPGIEKAVEEAGNDGLPDPDEEGDEEDLLTAPARLAGKAEQLRLTGAVSEDQATLLIADARPRSLYVQRKLLNAGEFVRWAKEQGFAEPLEAGDLHVKICYSRKPVDWLSVGSAWNEDEKGNLTVPAGGARIVEPLGDKGAVVLLFNSSALSWRHEELVRKGASHDFDEYQPHVTITYAKPADLDLDGIEPFRGKLVFGPEIFQEVDEDWAPKQGGGRKAAGPFN